MNNARNAALAEYLRERRSLLRPEDAGLPKGSRRRVSGLRREEVASLAGISPDYYVRIEQGRERHPSEQVLTAISHALQLDGDAETYMFSLAHGRSSQPRHEIDRYQPTPEWADLIADWPCTAAHLHDHSLTVVVANRLAEALSPHFAPGVNALRALFLEPDMREFYRDWQDLTRWAVRWVRAYASRNANPQLSRLIRELYVQSEHFARLWTGHDVKQQSNGLMRVNHPIVGELDLNFQHLAVPRSSNTLVLYWAAPGSESQERLHRISARPRQRLV